MAIFGDIFASCVFSEPSAAGFVRRLRLGEEKKKNKKKEITGQKYNGLPYYIGRPSQTTG